MTQKYFNIVTGIVTKLGICLSTRYGFSSINAIKLIRFF